MPALQLINPTSVTLTPSVDGSGKLTFAHQGTSLNLHEDTLHIKHESLPITIELTDFSDSSGNWTVTAEHEDEHDTTQTWSRNAGTARCFFSWSETNQVHAVKITAKSDNSSVSDKEESVLISVDPYPDQPDPV
ncbi:MAG: hypothetical protein AAGF11_24985 [Myxococcota bacterium]